MTTVRNQSQREMPLLGAVKRSTFAPWGLVEKCRDTLDAVRLCVQLSGLPNEHIAGELHIDKGHFTRMMQGLAHFPTRKFQRLMNVCGNLAPVQFLAMSCGLRLVDQQAHRIAELEAEINKLRAA
jgi:hypothetical protein